MKEALNQKILKIEDRELRSLVRYEEMVSWHKSGGFQRASAAYHAQIAEADRAKAVAELRINQIEVLQTAVSRFDAKAVRNAQIAEVAAKHRGDAAERQAIQEAIDEVLALEEIVPADDIDDILSQVSNALGIELPTDADRADICQRGHKSMDDLKRELGPSLRNQRMVAHEKDQFHGLAKTDRFAKLIQAYSTSVAHHHLMKECADEPLWISSFDHMIACRNRLHEAIVTLQDYAADVVAKQTPDFLVEPANEVQTKSILRTKFSFKAAWFRPEGTDEWVPFPNEDKVSSGYEIAHSQAVSETTETEKTSSPVRDTFFASRHAALEYLLANCDVIEASIFDWVDKYYPEEAPIDDVLDDQTLDASWKAANDSFDAGKTLAQVGWSPPSDEPPDPPHGIRSIA